MGVHSWPLYNDALVFDELAGFIGNAHFLLYHLACCLHAIGCSSPLLSTSLWSPPLSWFRCWAICLPWHPTFVFACGHLENFLFVVQTMLTTEQKTLPCILCNYGHHFFNATWMNKVLTPLTITCLQGFILFKTPCTTITARPHLRHAACVNNKLISKITKNSYIKSYC